MEGGAPGVAAEAGEVGEVEVGPGGEVRVGDAGSDLGRVEEGANLEHPLGMAEAGELGLRIGRGDGLLEGVDAPVEVREDGLVGVADLGGGSRRGGGAALGGEALGAQLLVVDPAVAVDEAVLDEAADGGGEEAGQLLPLQWDPLVWSHSRI